MGASRSISRAYKCALALSICVQLEMFFYFASIGVFLDEIRKRLLGADPEHRILFLVGYSITSACIVPWLYVVSNPMSLLRLTPLTHLPMQAWYGVRRESKKMMYGFFALSVLYLGVSGSMFTVSSVRSCAAPVVLTSSCHVVKYLPDDLQVLDIHCQCVRSLLGPPHCGRRPLYPLHTQLWDRPPPLL